MRIRLESTTHKCILNNTGQDKSNQYSRKKSQKEHESHHRKSTHGPTQICTGSHGRLNQYSISDRAQAVRSDAHCEHCTFAESLGTGELHIVHLGVMHDQNNEFTCHKYKRREKNRSRSKFSHVQEHEWLESYHCHFYAKDEFSWALSMLCCSRWDHHAYHIDINSSKWASPV